MKLGNVDVPNYPLLESIDAVKKIYEQLKREEITREHIAGILGFAATSGGFNMRLYDLKLFGLIEGRAKFRVTDLAVKATFGTNDERAIALDTAVKNVPLWTMFYEKWGVSIPVDTFWIDLAEMAGIERTDSKKEADKVRKLYMEDVKNILPVKEPVQVTSEPAPAQGGARDRSTGRMAEPTQVTAKGFVAFLGFPEYIEKPLVIKDQLSLTIAKELMKAIEDRIKKLGEEPNSDDAGKSS